MDIINMPEEIAKVLRTGWESQKKTMEIIEGQTEKFMQMCFTQDDTLRAESKEMLKRWIDMVKQAQAQYKKMMEENLAKIAPSSK